MKNPEKAIELIFDSSTSFEERCSAVFQFQAAQAPIFKRFLEPFGLKEMNNPTPCDIPLLPIRGFKDGKIIVKSERKKPELIFRSSGTLDMTKSTHYILYKKLYETAILEEFQNHFPFDEYLVLFYLPGYDQNPDSSLIWMANHIIKSDPTGQSRFISSKEFVDIGSLIPIKKRQILLFGAAFGLMDLIESKEFKPVDNVIIEILETGGMKTHRREITKSLLREKLSNGFQIPQEKIHSEYGMCELLSQMYATGTEWFETPHWVDVSIRDPQNPSRICDVGEEGKIGLIDLANVYSCPFILTDDRGVMDEAGRFKVLGRWNPDDLRGCNFLVDHE